MMEAPFSLQAIFTMFRSRATKTAQRKYIDLIWEAGTRWPNWDPSTGIHAGDFGTIIEDTGELEVEGNIYTHTDTKQIASQYPAVDGDEVDHIEIVSERVQKINIGPSIGLNVPTAQSLSLKFQWQFNSRRGAILVVYKPKPTRVPDQFFNPETRSLPILQGKMVVNQAWTCPGFYMYLSSKSSESVVVGLQTNVDNPAAPATNVIADMNVGWAEEGCSGTRQYSYRKNATYTPLFCLKEIRNPLSRRSKSDSERDGDGEYPGAPLDQMRTQGGNSGWYEADVPWNDLDDEGVPEAEVAQDNDPDDNDDDD